MMVPMTVSLITLVSSSLKKPVASSFINAITGKGQEGEFLTLLALILTMKVLKKGVTRAGSGYNNVDHMKKMF